MQLRLNINIIIYIKNLSDGDKKKIRLEFLILKLAFI